MPNLPLVLVPVLSISGGKRSARLEPATQRDMPLNWTCSWVDLFRLCTSEFQGIIKFTYEQEILGLLRYSLYPDLGTLEIENLEVKSSFRGKMPSRTIKPIGKWLIWYVVQVALRSIPTPAKNFIFLSAEDRYELIEYYRETIQMNLLGCKTIAPGEVGNAFSFSQEAATEFCKKLGQQMDSYITPF